MEYVLKGEIEMNFSLSSMIIYSFVGLIGTGYFMYGKRAQNFSALLCGLGMMIYPLFVSNIWVGIIIFIALCIIPFVM